MADDERIEEEEEIIEEEEAEEEVEEEPAEEEVEEEIAEDSAAAPDEEEVEADDGEAPEEEEVVEDDDSAGGGVELSDDGDGGGEVELDDAYDEGSTVVSEEIVSEEIEDIPEGEFSIVDAIMKSIVLFIVGVICFPLAVYLLWSGENVVEYSEMVKNAAAVSTDSVPSDGSLVKFSGSPSGDFLKTPSIRKKPRFDVLYYSYKVEKEYVRKKTSTEYKKVGKNKRKKIKKVKYVKQFETAESKSESVPSFKVGSVEVKTAPSSPDWMAEELATVKVRVKGVTPPPPKTEGFTGIKRKTVRGVRADRPVFVCGTVKGGAVQAEEGKPFVVTNKSEKDVVDSMALAEAASRWGQRILALILLYLGFYGLFNPFVRASEFAGEYLGVLGVFAKLFYFVAAGLSLFIWVIGIIAVKLLWLIAVLMVVGLFGAGYMIIQAVKARQAGKAAPGKAAAAPPPIPS